MTVVLFLLGATASGKKHVAARLAGPLDAELLSLDSMKVYRGMDRGTDKARATSFGLTDLVAPDQPFSVGDYLREAVTAVAEIRARRHLPLFVGGTGLYLRALVRGLFEGPEVDPAVRETLRRRLQQEGPDRLHEELRRVDPEAAERIHARDHKRLIRALEVHAATGRSISDWQREATVVPVPGPKVLVGIRWPAAQLRRRIEARVERMLGEGLVEEVRGLRERQALGRTAAEAIGYREVVELLDGDLDEAQCREAIARNTRRLVRRQANWFRQFPEIRWVDTTHDRDLPERVLQTFREGIRAASGRSPAGPDQ